MPFSFYLRVTYAIEPDSDIFLYLILIPPQENNKEDSEEELSHIILATDLFWEFTKSVDASRIGDAIQLYQMVLLEERGSRTLAKSAIYNARLGLSDSLYMRSHVSESIDDITTSITLLKQALGPPTQIADHRRVNCALCLSARLYTLYIRTGGMDILNEADNFFHPKEDEIAHTAWKMGTSQISSPYESAISHFLKSLSLRPKLNYRRTSSLVWLYLCLRKRYEESKRPSDLDESLKYGEELLERIPSPHPYRPVILHFYGPALIQQAIYNQDLKILEKSMLYCRESLDLEADNRLRVQKMLILATTLLGLLSGIRLWGGSNDTSDWCYELRGLSQRLIPYSTFPQEDWEVFSSILSHSLVALYHFQHQIEDIHAAVTILQHRIINGHPDRRLSLLLALEGCLAIRVNVLYQSSDIKDWISTCREQLKLLKPDDHTARSSAHSNIAFCEFLLSVKGKGLSDRHDEAISSLQNCLPTAVDNPALRVQMILPLSQILFYRYVYHHDPKDLDECISLQREAHSLQDDYMSQFCLGNALLQRSKDFEQPGDLEDGLRLSRQSVATMKAKNLDWTMGGFRLADTMLDAYIASDRQDIHHLEEAINIWREISSVSVSLERQYISALTWSRHAHSNRHHSALEAYTKAIELLPQIASIDKPVDTRHEGLGWQTFGLAGNLASFALVDAKRPDMAVEFLESARAVFWSQYLNLRPPLQDLEVASPELAGQLARLSTELRQSSFHDTGLPPSAEQWSQIMVDREGKAARSRQMRKSWDDTLHRIRGTVPGFENFMQPKKFYQLQQAASRGPVVLLFVSRVDDECHALVITQGDLHHVPLPISWTLANQLGQIFNLFGTDVMSSMDLFQVQSLFDQTSFDSRNARLKLKKYPKDPGNEVLEWDKCLQLLLHGLWSLVVFPIIEALQLQVSV